MEKNNLPHSLEKRGLDQDCIEVVIEDGDEKSNFPHSSGKRKLEKECMEAAIENGDEKSNLPHSSEKRKLEQECTKAAMEDDDLLERSVSGIHESLDPSVEEPSSKRQKVDLQPTEEQHFYKLFQKVLDNIKGSTGVSDEDVSQAITEIFMSFDFENPPADYSQTKIICGYLFLCATHSAGLARARILKAIRNCPELKSIMEKKDELRVVSIGGGPGSDALGFCSALSELEFEDWKWTSLSITVVDAVEGWRECVTLVDQHLREGEFGGVSKLFEAKNVTMSFVQANLPGDPDTDIRCYDALKKADIIIECKMMHRLSFELRYQIIEALSKTVKDDALVLPIHTPFYDQFWKYNFSFLYAPETNDFYRLSNINHRFGSSDSRNSESQIRVLRKNSQAEPEKIELNNKT